MKLTKRLFVNGKQVDLNKDQVRLDLFTPGKATFTVISDNPLKGLAQFNIGYNPEALRPFFIGRIDNSFRIDKKQQRIMCTELTGALSFILPIALRNVTLAEVLSAVSEKTGLEFVVPNAEYAKTKAPVFYSAGTGYHAMNTLGRIFRIPKHIWQQQGDGKIYVGSHNDSYWASRPASIPADLHDDCGYMNTATVPAIESLRAGVKLDAGIITNLTLTEATMQIEWAENPWGTRWKVKSTI